MELEPRFSESELRAAVRSIAARIDADYPDSRPILVGVLKGSFVFLADLVRELEVPFEVDFVRARSYGTGLRSKRRLKLARESCRRGGAPGSSSASCSPAEPRPTPVSRS